MSRSPSREPNNLYVYEAHQNLGRGLLQRETGVSPQYFITDGSKAVLLLWFILIVFVRPLPVSLWLFVHYVKGSLVDTY